MGKFIIKSLFVIVLAMANLASARAADPVLYGSVVDAVSWGAADIGKIGIYRIPTSANQEFELVAAGPDSKMGGVLVGQTYYAGYYRRGVINIPTIASYDVNTWNQLGSTGSDESVMANDLTYDPVTKKVYGSFKNGSGTGYVFGTINYSDAVVDRLSSSAPTWWALATDANGNMFGIAKTDTGSALYKVNKSNGSGTLIGETGCKPEYTTSAYIDPATGRMFWTVAAEDDTAGLYEVDKTTGQATLLCEFPDGEQVCGLFMIIPEAADDAPAACTDLEASFPNGNLSGTISFATPNKLFNGAAASGKISYTVSANSKEIAKGESTFGSKVSVPVTVEKGGKYTFTVVLSNAAGNSPEAMCEVYVGQGTPQAPKVDASYADGKFIVSWTVPESVNGGYIDPAKVTYKVVRYPSQVVVASAATGNSIEVPMDEPTGLTKFWYGVVATYNGVVSPEGLSNVVTLGSIVPPYSVVFQTEEDAQNHTIINSNNDFYSNGLPRQWAFDHGSMSVGFNNEADMDDWLITPAVSLEAGYAYVFTINAQAQSVNFVEKLEVKLGDAPTVEAMTGVVMEPFEFNNTEPEDFTGLITAPATGKYYIGIHGISPAKNYRIYVNSYSIGAPKSTAVPAAPTAMKLVPDANGAFVITATVTAPEKDIAGANLESLDRVELWRGTTLVKSFKPAEPGKSYTFTDEMSQGGLTEYRAIAYNGAGASPELSASVLVGVNKPAAPSKVSMVETEKDGEVTLSWPKVTTDEAGNPLNPDLVTYTVYQLQAETYVAIADDIAEDFFTFQAVKDGDQKFVHFFVSAQTSAGVSPLVESDYIPAGTPLSVPFYETFANVDTDHLMSYTDDAPAMWTLVGDNNSYGITSHTGDNGMLLSRGKVEGDYSTINTLKIHLSDIVKPGAMFYTYNITSDGADDNVVELLVYADGEWTTLTSCVISSLGTEAGWYLVSAPLDDYVGKDILVGIKTIAKAYHETFIDDLSVASMVADDLAVKAVTAPEAVNFNQPFTIDVVVENKGVQTKQNVVVKLYADGDEAQSQTIKQLNSGSSTAVTFECNYNALTAAASTFTVEVVDDKDEFPDDNKSKAFKVDINFPTLPVVEALKGEIHPNGVVTLSWEEPATAGYEAVAVTDDFESYDSFIKTGIGDWTTVDGDKGIIGSITDVEIPNIPYNSKQSWWVMDGSYQDFNKSFNAHSGKKYLAQMFVIDGTSGLSIPCEDWLISPELTGKEQTVSFYARSYSNTYPETFEVLYSTTGNNVADFKSVDSHSEIPATWELYSFDLPVGSKYFAIVARSQNKYMLFIDDITYTPLSAGDLTVKGYNLWRNGIKLNDAPVAEAKYSDTDADASKDADYRVTVVYDKGESMPSPKATITVSGLDAALAGQAVEVTGGVGIITVSGAEGVVIDVYTAAGVRTASAEGVGRNSFTVAAGMYIVRVGSQAFKVVVK